MLTFRVTRAPVMKLLGNTKQVLGFRGGEEEEEEEKEEEEEEEGKRRRRNG